MNRPAFDRMPGYKEPDSDETTVTPRQALRREFIRLLDSGWPILGNLLDAVDRYEVALRSGSGIAAGTCARYWGSDGTLCSTHNGRFLSDTSMRCDRNPVVGSGIATSEAPTDLPVRIVVGKNGAYWRDYGDHYSMAIVSEDNDPVEVVAIYNRQHSDPDLGRSIDAVADALNAWDQGEEPRPDTHRHWSKIVKALSAPTSGDAHRPLREALTAFVNSNWRTAEWSANWRENFVDDLRAALAAPPSPVGLDE